jgi:UDP-N-acetylglucosamine--N-acetylmuramyl-(pentapeptide) pyrophosphoryl-undecaprenol N-acetylglucosamine transferase
VTVAPTAGVGVIIGGGGTGGHVFPALALAEELVARGLPRARIHFVGARRGIEASAVPAAGYSVDLLPGRGFLRGVTLEHVAQNLRTVGDTLVAVARASAIVRRRRPAVVVGVGGYASLPVLVAAWLHRVPMVVHESDAHPGLANRIAVRLGARPAVTLPGTALAGAVVTGNPIRPAILAVRREPVTPPLVAVVGGSLGARSINLAALELYDRWRDRDDVAIHHVSGARDYEECRARLDRARRADDALRYRLVGFEEHMETVYAEAAVIVSRSGGMTAELTAVGVPSVLVPLPGAPGDHQTHNAEALVLAGAAAMIPDAELDGARVDAVLRALLGDGERLDAMARAAHALGRPDATARFADLVEEVARGGA